MEAASACARLLAWYTPRWRQRTAVMFLFLAVYCTYRPALRHPPRQDHWSFLLETAHEHRFWPMLVHTYSYNRSQVAGWGDYPLFRPCLFAVLCAEKALFGPRYEYCQAVGLALHCAVVWIFVRLLLRLHALHRTGSVMTDRLRLVLAYALALFFAVNIVGTEMVSWCHIHGYMLFLLLVLGSLLLLVDEVCGTSLPVVLAAAPAEWGASSARFRHFGGALVLLLLAAFTYETGQFYAVCVGAVLALVSFSKRRFRRGLLLFALFAMILPIYRSADALDRRAHPETRPDITEKTVLQNARWQPTITHARRYLLFTLWQPLFPSCPEWRFADRLRLPEPGAAPLAYFRLEPFLFISYGVVVLGSALALWQLGRTFVRARSRSALLFLLLPACLIMLHLGIIVLGRMNLRPDSMVLALNSYYAYTPLAALLLGLYYLWTRLPSARAGSAALCLLLGGFAALSGFSACKVHAMTTQISFDCRFARRQIDFVQHVIDRHHHDPSFAFSFEPGLFYSLKERYGVTQLEILFRRFINHEQPTHVICMHGAEWCLMPEAEYCYRFGGPRYRQLATFVGVGASHFMVYRWQQQFYGLHSMEGRFRPDRDDYYYLVKGDSVADVLRQVPAALARLDADQDAGRFIRADVHVIPLDRSSNGFGLYQAGDRFYAVPAAEGPLVSPCFLSNHYSKWFCASSLAELEGVIARSAGTADDILPSD